jgi:hypothetical protein
MRGAVVAGIAIVCLTGGQAHAACRAISPADQSRLAPLILTGVFESGPFTPAVIRVEAWEKGKGPDVVEVDTGIYEDYSLGEGISPNPGERWRIYGELDGDVVLTGACDGSRLVTAEPLAPAAGVGSAKTTLAPATWNGTALAPSAPLPRIPAPRGKRVRFSPGVVAVRVLGARKARAAGTGGRFAYRMPAKATRPVRIIADTGSGFFAAVLRPVS